MINKVSLSRRDSLRANDGFWPTTAGFESVFGAYERPLLDIRTTKSGLVCQIISELLHLDSSNVGG